MKTIFLFLFEHRKLLAILAGIAVLLAGPGCDSMMNHLILVK